MNIYIVPQFYTFPKRKRFLGLIPYGKPIDTIEFIGICMRDQNGYYYCAYNQYFDVIRFSEDRENSSAYKLATCKDIQDTPGRNIKPISEIVRDITEFLNDRASEDLILNFDNESNSERLHAFISAFNKDFFVDKSFKINKLFGMYGSAKMLSLQYDKEDIVFDFKEYAHKSINQKVLDLMNLHKKISDRMDFIHEQIKNQ